MSPRAVAVSPHLDDAVFSVGATLARLADRGWDVRVLTCFTGSVDPASASEFALSTQLDKGLGADVDYMALRRAEDVEATAVLGVEPVHLPLLEAPHRGYTSAADLFAGRHRTDDVGGALASALADRVRGADLVLAPQAVGNHVDHRVVATVVAALADAGVVDGADVAWWRDAPYALRHPDAAGAPEVPDLPEAALAVGDLLGRKGRAARCYRTQVGFQFGDADEVGPTLTRLADAEGARCGVGTAVEALRVGARAAGRLDPDVADDSADYAAGT